MATITASVGNGGVNRADDVRTVQTLLAQHADWLAPLVPPAVTGVADEATIAAITSFQTDPGALLAPDGRVDPGGFTLRWLSREAIPRRQHPVFGAGPFTHAGGRPTDAEFQAAATRLSCEVAAIKAVSEVETGIRGSWEADGRPVVLYERHYFKRFTDSAFDGSHSDLSGSPPNTYGLYRMQHVKLRRAAALNEEAALKSASWGGYQIMGANFASAGFASVAAFVSGQMESESRQLAAFVSVVIANRSWLKAIQDKDWTAFASGYNGPGYRANDYDTKMREAYERLAPPPAPVPPAGRAAPPAPRTTRGF